MQERGPLGKTQHKKKKKTVDTDKYRFKILKVLNTDYKETILGILETKGKSQKIFKI